MTKYHVLQQMVGNTAATVSEAANRHLWAVVAEVEAFTVEGAIRKHLEGGKEGGTFIAIPSRSFKPLVVAVEQVTKVTVS